MTDQRTRERVTEIVTAVYASGVTPADATDAEQPADWDSLRHIEIMLAVEEEFGITIAEGDFASLRSIDAIAAHIGNLHAPR